MKKPIILLLIIPALTSCLHKEQIFPEKKKETVTTQTTINLVGKKYIYSNPDCIPEFGIGGCRDFISFNTDTQASGVMQGDIASIYTYKVSGNIITLFIGEDVVANTYLIRSNEVIVEKSTGHLWTLETPVK